MYQILVLALALLSFVHDTRGEVLSGQTVKDILTKHKCLCPCGREWDGSKGFLIPFDAGNWFEAVSHCSSQGMQIAQLRDRYDSQDLQQWLNEQGYGSSESFWIGANDLAKPGLFRWGLTAKEVTFSQWAQNEPNFLTIRGETEHCVSVNANNMEWNDSVCSKRLKFICERFED